MIFTSALEHHDARGRVAVSSGLLELGDERKAFVRSGENGEKHGKTMGNHGKNHGESWENPLENGFFL